MELSEIQMEPIFPVFFKYYDDHPVGTAVLRNRGSMPVDDIKVSFFVEEYMTNPKICEAPTRLEPGQRGKVELFGLFTERVLAVSESTKVSARITVECAVKGREHRNEYIEVVRMHDRNAITWDDDRKAAAFVTMKDPMVMQFSKNVARVIGNKLNRAVDPAFQTAVAMHEALSLYGMRYVVDPTTPYREMSQQKLAVDYLQFPRQSLDYKTGDCDDLSILYSALLESVGVETAFITVPGHIFAAVALDLPPSEAKKQFLMSGNLILFDDRVWLPLEITERERGFNAAWEAGAKQWTRLSPTKRCQLYPMSKSWEIYEPVGFSGVEEPLAFPDERALVEAFQREVNMHVESEIQPRAAKLEEEVRRSGGSSRIVNRLAVLYARYGLYDKARGYLNRILEKEPYVPALVNMGNMYYMNFNYEKALQYFEQAVEQQPNNSRALLAIARVHHAMENYGIAKRVFNRLKQVDQDLAEQFAFLELRGEEADRASRYGRLKEVLVWDEE
jgi:tetratricopeptide (TPR) repeat protein